MTDRRPEPPVAGAPAPASPGLTHLDARGQVHMVDVGDKPVTRRVAVAAARLRMAPATARLLVQGGAKGDALATARVAGVMAAKQTAALIPLCHPLPLSHVSVDIHVDTEAGLTTVRTRCETVDRTGVEMEALTAASVAALTLYDMVKAVDRGLVIEQVRLLEKSGGRSGRWAAEEGAAPEATSGRGGGDDAARAPSPTTPSGR